MAAGRPSADRETVASWVREHTGTPINWAGWTAIDHHERALDEPAGRPRIKLTALEDLHAVADRC
ncbi:hypothetical protein [Parafrankia sp. FMc2]|uniref:hypothetical protein n=1 Tax=Parafrankia sp. FMc2 TaxID=3233196 RepID=UPI0034D65B5D